MIFSFSIRYSGPPAGRPNSRKRESVWRTPVWSAVMLENINIVLAVAVEYAARPCSCEVRAHLGSLDIHHRCMNSRASRAMLLLQREDSSFPRVWSTVHASYTLPALSSCQRTPTSSQRRPLSCPIRVNIICSFHEEEGDTAELTLQRESGFPNQIAPCSSRDRSTPSVGVRI